MSRRTTVLDDHGAPPRRPLRSEGERVAEQERLNGLPAGEDIVATRLELLGAADRAHEAHPRYEGHWDRWFLARMEEDHEATVGTEIHAGDLVLYMPTPNCRHGSPFTAYSVRAGGDIMLPAEMAEALARVADETPEIEPAPGNPSIVSNVKIDGVIIGSVTKLGEDSFVAYAYATDPGVDYTIGGRENAEAAARRSSPSGRQGGHRERRACRRDRV